MHLGLYARRLPAVEGWWGKKNPCGRDDSGGLGLLETFLARSQLYIYCIFTLKAVNSFQNYYNYKFILYFYLKKNM
jgi:hypothetical protein